MIASILAALSTVVLSPATSQAAFIQEPKASPTSSVGEIRLVLRRSSDLAETVVPPGMTLIPAGKTVIGTDLELVEKLGQRIRGAMTDILAETPRHEVLVESYFIDVTEVTNLQWKVFLDATGREPSDTLLEFNWPDGEIPDGMEYMPVTNVNIPEIKDYLVWSGKRLPDEYEWTRAARGDDDRDYPWGPRWEMTQCRSGLDLPNAPVAVGSYPSGASPFGVLDMAGNVFEWVDSPFRAFDDFEPMNISKKKKDADILTPEFDSRNFVIKGGGFTNNKQFIRIDVRVGYNPADSDHGLGFRAARSLKAGLEPVRHAYRRLQPAQFARFDMLDTVDMFGREITSFDESRGLITGFRYLAFAHKGPERGVPLSRLRRDSIDEPAPLGVLATSEPIVLADMAALDGAERILPAGEYTLAFKGKGESKAYKDKKKLERKNGGKPDKDEEHAEPGEGEGEDGAGIQLGAAAPWPGLFIHDIQEDIDFPQEEDIILLYNANNVVVAWMLAGEVLDGKIEPVAESTPDGGRTWEVEFSLNPVIGGGKKGPRFHLTLELANGPL